MAGWTVLGRALADYDRSYRYIGGASLKSQAFSSLFAWHFLIRTRFSEMIDVFQGATDSPVSMSLKMPQLPNKARKILIALFGCQ